MSSNIYENESGVQKCQCITFDDQGKILGSTEELFPAFRLTSDRLKQEFPFLWKVISALRSGKLNDDPLFFPKVEFEINGYRNICDFTFMSSEDAMGIRRFICLIYDNSIHYRDQLRNFSGKTKKQKVQL